jgi:hypothetical protein
MGEGTETLLEVVRRLAENEMNTDSLEFGTPSKGGAVKVYGNFSDEGKFKEKIDTAFRVKEYARQKQVEFEQV